MWITSKSKRRQQAANDAARKLQRENRAARNGFDPAMDEDTAMFFIPDRIAGDGFRHNVDSMPAPRKLGTLPLEPDAPAPFNG